MLNNDNQSQPRQEATFAEKRSSKRPSEDPRRQHSRHCVDLDVTMASDHNFYAGFAENISEGGIFIATHMLKPVGEKIEFTINLPNISTPITGVGEVRWVRVYSEESNVPPGLGLRFVSLGEGCEDAIRQFLEARDPIFYDDEL